jgi:protein-disulfide isomerase
MSLRHPHALVAGAFLLGACSQKQAPAKAAAPDSLKAVPASAAASQPTDSALLRADKARIQGSENAKVWLIVASDFQCPYCKQFHDQAYQSIVKDYVNTGKIRLAYLNHPGSSHVYGVISAEAAMCAAIQDRFWPMHDALFATQEHWEQLPDPKPVFDSLATSLQLQMPDWRECMTSHQTRPMIDADHAKSVAGGVDGTPSFFIGGKLAVKGVAPYRTYRAALDSALAQAGPPGGGGSHP